MPVDTIAFNHLAALFFFLLLLELLGLSIAYTFLDAREGEETVHRGSVISLNVVVVCFQNNLCLAVGTAVEPDKLEYLLGYALVLTESVKHHLNIRITEADTCRSVE